MTTKAPFLFCRLCGVRFRSDQVAEHEKNCSYDSSKQSSKEIFIPVSSKDSGINELRDKVEYYKEEQPSAPEEKKEKDPTSNEESKDSPLNLASKTDNWGNEEEKKTVKFDNDVEVKGSKSDAKENNSKESKSSSDETAKNKKGLEKESHEKQKDESKPKDKSTDKKMSRSSSSKEKEGMESKPYPDENTSEAVARTPYPSEESKYDFSY
ncbi:hypothetical protein TNCT_72771 [Trichonephila clavata]|uniref:Uncharacterized protein n=1 Tax=Trichonephila clavata TaxID=2740835 RepID=A0A8X6JEI3_TRICU|nr:hypothetical protein TNCT_72771 [Trichonephila clavata]